MDDQTLMYIKDWLKKIDLKEATTDDWRSELLRRRPQTNDPFPNHIMDSSDDRFLRDSLVSLRRDGDDAIGEKRIKEDAASAKEESAS